MEEFLRCLNCGKTLASKEKENYSYCAECILNLKFQLSDLNQEDINQNLQKILDFAPAIKNIPENCKRQSLAVLLAIKEMGSDDIFWCLRLKKL